MQITLGQFLIGGALGVILIFRDPLIIAFAIGSMIAFIKALTKAKRKHSLTKAALLLIFSAIGCIATKDSFIFSHWQAITILLSSTILWGTALFLSSRPR